MVILGLVLSQGLILFLHLPVLALILLMGWTRRTATGRRGIGKGKDGLMIIMALMLDVKRNLMHGL